MLTETNGVVFLYLCRCWNATALFVSTIHNWTSLVIVLKWPNCTWSELVHSGLTLAPLLWPVMTNCDHARPCYVHLWPFCDQTWPDATKCNYACMAGAFVSDLRGCQSKITKSMLKIIISVLKGVYPSHDHNMPSLYIGSISITNWLQQMIFGESNQSQTHAQQQHLMTSWNGLEVTYIYTSK